MEEESPADEDDPELTTRLDPTAVDVTAAIDPTVVSSNYKTRGRRSAPDGTGVLGHNTATSGVASGVEGVTDSLTDDAAGVTGKATNATGQTVGVYGATASPVGTGVRGQTAGSGSGTGVHGLTTTPGGIGVRGENTASGEYSSTGIYGGTQGKGWENYDPTWGYIYGYAYGVQGHAEAADGVIATAGVKGRNDANSGVAYGVWGTTDAKNTQAAGVLGSSLYDATPALRGNGRLHVSTSIDSTTSVAPPSNYAAYVENADTSDNHFVVAIKSGYTGDPTVGHNFVQFLDGNDNGVGRIEGNGGGGVAYETSGADYAEALPRLDADESIEAGDVVGVVEGAVTKETPDAARVLAITDAPAVTGNAPADGDDAEDTETVAFTGQIPVRIRGPVQDGDLVVPSGEDDGTGVAVAPEDREPGTPIVGQAWESTDEPGVDQVTVAIGLDDPAVLDADRRIADLERENEDLRTRIESLEEGLARDDAAIGTDGSGAAGTADLPADD